jgi:hypothetical protein
LIDDNNWPTVLQACRILPVEVNLGKGHGVLSQGGKQQRFVLLQPASYCDCVRKKCFTPCHRFRASDEQQTTGANNWSGQQGMQRVHDA